MAATDRQFDAFIDKDVFDRWLPAVVAVPSLIVGTELHKQMYRHECPIIREFAAWLKRIEDEAVQFVERANDAGYDGGTFSSPPKEQRNPREAALYNARKANTLTRRANHALGTLEADPFPGAGVLNDFEHESAEEHEQALATVVRQAH